MFRIAGMCGFLALALAAPAFAQQYALFENVGGVYSLAFSSDGKLALSGSGEVGTIGTIKLWDLASGAEVRTFGE